MSEMLKNLNVHELKKYLANRYPYLLMDKAEEIVPGERAVGYKNFTANEWFFPVHFPDEPIVPAMIQLEACLQCLSLTVLTGQSREAGVVRCIQADNVKFRERVQPGSRFVMETQLLSWNEADGTGVGHVRGLVGGVEACTADLTIQICKP
jgi:3-hydroxyacyl-[acyl-carrier-protein] dehydratase